MPAARRVGIPGVAVLIGGLGIYLVYAGIEDVPPIDGLRDLLKGRAPAGRAQAGRVDWANLGTRVEQIGTIPPGGFAADLPASGSGNIVNAGHPPSRIMVDRSIEPGVRWLQQVARQQGAMLSGWGYRSHQEQINLRRQNCGTSHYDIYEKPSGQCSPPTARPGQSMHERGLAVDFQWNGTLIPSQSHPGFRFLANHAPFAGLRNLPSEPWHWSTTGT